MIKKIVALGIILTPFAATAAIGGFKDFVTNVISTIAIPFTTVIMGLTVTYLLWNIAEVIRKSGQAEERQKLKDRILWGTIALAVMTSLWGLAYIVLNSFGWEDSSGAPIHVNVVNLPALP